MKAVYEREHDSTPTWRYYPVVDGSIFDVLAGPPSEVEGALNNYFPSRKPEPTGAQPGTDEKIQVLADRVIAGEELWHPDDAGMESPEAIARRIASEVYCRE